MSLNRRRFAIVLLGGAGGALTLGFYLRARTRSKPFDPGPTRPGEVNAYVAISSDDSVVIRVAKAEMGQGVLTALAMIVAEELECRWEDVSVEAADVNRSLRASRYYGSFRTDGSASVRGSRRILQQVGAHARWRLIAAAAKRWGVPMDECEARDGEVRHGPSNRIARFGALVADASTLDVPVGKIAIKSPAQYRLLGRSVPRVDVPRKVAGEPVYGIDVRVPEMLYAAVLHCPVLGGTVHQFKPGPPGAEGLVFALSDAIAAVAQSYWQARSALRDLDVSWNAGTAQATSTSDLRAKFLAALDKPGAIAMDRGSAVRLIEKSDSSFEATYDVPYLAHACMEPMNCTASVSKDRVDIWVGTQDPEAVIELARTMLGYDLERIYVHPQWMGGGFGRRVSTDYVAEALEIARRVGKPVKVIWSREQDMRRGLYRPMSACWLSAVVASGSASALVVRSVTDSIFARHRPGDLKDGIDPTSTMGLTNTPYAWDHLRIECHNMDSPIPTWFWRSVGDSQNAFAVESFMDELAAHIGTDGVSLRRRLLRDRPRYLGVLAALEQKVDIREVLPRGRGRGLAIHEYANTVVAQVVEVNVADTGALTVLRVVAVVDCGHVVNPRTVEQQIEGAIVFGLSAALFGEVSIESGRVVQGNFDTYRVLTMRDCPAIEVHLSLSGGETWGGIGEAGVPPVAAALCNAIHAATRKRIRSLPVARHDLTWFEQ